MADDGATQALWGPEDDNLFEPLPSSQPAAPLPEVGSLTIETPAAGSTTLPLYLGVNVVTRGSSNASFRGQNSSTGESTVELAASSVSKCHATLELHREGLLWFLTDLGSTNGVFISKSGRQVRCQPYCKYGLSSGDRVRFGDVEATVCAWAAESDGGGGEADGGGQDTAQLHGTPEPLTTTTAAAEGEAQQMPPTEEVEERGEGDGMQEGVVRSGKGTGGDNSQFDKEETEQLGAETVPEEVPAETQGEGDEPRRTSVASEVDGGAGVAMEEEAADNGARGRPKTPTYAGDRGAAGHGMAVTNPAHKSDAIPTTHANEFVSGGNDANTSLDGTQELTAIPTTDAASPKGSRKQPPESPVAGVVTPLGPGWRTAKAKAGTPSTKATEPKHDLDDNLRATAEALISRHKEELQRNVPIAMPSEPGSGSGGMPVDELATDSQGKLNISSAEGWRSRKTAEQMEQDGVKPFEKGEAKLTKSKDKGEGPAAKSSGVTAIANKGPVSSSGSETELPDDNENIGDEGDAGTVVSSRQVEPQLDRLEAGATGGGNAEIERDAPQPVNTAVREPSDSDAPTTPILETMANSDFEDADYGRGVSGVAEAGEDEERESDAVDGRDRQLAPAAKHLPDDGKRAGAVEEGKLDSGRVANKAAVVGAGGADDAMHAVTREAVSGEQRDGGIQDDYAGEDVAKPTPPGEETQAAVHALEGLVHGADASGRSTRASRRSAQPSPKQAIAQLSGAPTPKTSRRRRQAVENAAMPAELPENARHDELTPKAARRGKQLAAPPPQHSKEVKPAIRGRKRGRTLPSLPSSEAPQPTPNTSVIGDKRRQPPSGEAELGASDVPNPKTRAGGRRRADSSPGAVVPTAVDAQTNATPASPKQAARGGRSRRARTAVSPVKTSEAVKQSDSRMSPRKGVAESPSDLGKSHETTPPSSMTRKTAFDGRRHPGAPEPSEKAETHDEPMAKVPRKGRRRAGAQEALEGDKTEADKDTPKVGAKQRAAQASAKIVDEGDERNAEEPPASEERPPHALTPKSNRGGSGRGVSSTARKPPKGTQSPMASMEDNKRGGGVSERKRQRSAVEESSQEGTDAGGADSQLRTAARRRVSTKDGFGCADASGFEERGESAVRVMFSTCIGKALLKRHTTTITALGGSVAEPSDENFSHYVTINGNARDKTTGFIKSFKTLLALAAGRPIVDIQWLEACKLQKQFVGVEEFLLKDPAAEKEYNFSIAGSYAAARSQLLLTGFHVFFTPKLLKDERSPEQLKSLVMAAGGEVVDKLPAGVAAGRSSSRNESPPTDVLVFATSSDKSWCRSHLRTGTAVYGREQLVAALMQQRLPSSPAF